MFRYLREVFHNSLPHESTLRKWCANLDRGGLTYASHEISKVSEIAESKIQDAQMKDKLFCDRQILNRICLKTVSNLNDRTP